MSCTLLIWRVLQHLAETVRGITKEYLCSVCILLSTEAYNELTFNSSYSSLEPVHWFSSVVLLEYITSVITAFPFPSTLHTKEHKRTIQLKSSVENWRDKNTAVFLITEWLNPSVTTIRWSQWWSNDGIINDYNNQIRYSSLHIIWEYYFTVCAY